MVDQLNQDPHADLVANSAQDTASMGEGRADVAGDEEVEHGEDGSTAPVAASPGVTDLDWDPHDPLIEFDDENSGGAHVPVATSTPSVTGAEDEIPELEDAGPEELLQTDLPQRQDPNASLGMLARGPAPDYADVPLNRFRHPELHQVFPWIRFEAQNMCKPPWRTELALISQDEIV